MSTFDEIADEIASLAAHLDAATARLLACIRAFDAGGGWLKQGAVSCAHWLSWRISVDLPTAREKVRVARALATLPAIDEALARGELSYAKVRALTRVATPENEQRLLDLARHATGAQLERICRSYRLVAANLMDDGPLVEERSVRERLLPGGMVRLELVLHPDEAALVRLALEKARDDLRRARREQPTPPDIAPANQVHPVASTAPAPPAAVASASVASVASTASAPRPGSSTPCTSGSAAGSLAPASRPWVAPLQEHGGLVGGGRAGRARCRDGRHVSAESAEGPVVSLADAAVSLAESFLANGVGAGSGNGGDRYQVFVHLDEDVLGQDGAWAATLDDGTRLPAETLRRLACDCGLVATRTDGSGSVLDVGRRTRSIPPAIRRALWVRDRGCRFPGCDHTRFLHGHHVRHWLSGGETRLENLVLLCSRHHQLLHEGGGSLEPGREDGALVFRTGDGARLPAVPSPDVIEDAQTRLQAWAAERGLELGPDTNLPWWDGATPDYDWIMSTLFSEPTQARWQRHD